MLYGPSIEAESHQVSSPPNCFRKPYNLSGKTLTFPSDILMSLGLNEYCNGGWCSSKSRTTLKVHLELNKFKHFFLSCMHSCTQLQAFADTRPHTLTDLYWYLMQGLVHDNTLNTKTTLSQLLPDQWRDSRLHRYKATSL